MSASGSVSSSASGSSAPPAPRLQVALGGAVGAGVRVAAVLAIGAVAGAGGWPWAVLLVNLVGALLLGVVVGRAASSPRVARWSPLVGTGLAGSLTTFSALAVDLLQLVGDRPGLAVAYGAVSLAAGTLLAWVGLRWGRS